MDAKTLGAQAAHPLTPEAEQSVCHDGAGWGSLGLTKREHTAIEMAKALIATAGAPVLGGLDGAEHYTAQAAIRMADALLAELAKATP